MACEEYDKDDNIDDADYMDYNGVDDYYPNYYGNIDDNDDLMVEIVNCKKRITEHIL